MADQLDKLTRLCSFHPGFICESFSTDSKILKQCPFVCIRCILEKRAPLNSLILIEDALNVKEGHVLTNWPVLNNQGEQIIQLIDKMVQQEAQKSNHIDLRLQIAEFFDGFQAKILKTISETKKDLLIQADKYINLSNTAIDLYREIAEIEKLQEILGNNNRQTESESISQLQELVLKKANEIDTNTSRLETAIQLLEEQKVLFDFEFPKTIENSIQESIKKITFFQLDDQVAASFQQSLIQSTVKKECKNAHQIISLIANKSNMCSAKFLKEIEQVLSKFNFIFDSVNFDCKRNDAFQDLTLTQKQDKNTLTNSVIEDKIFRKINNNSNVHAYMTQPIVQSLKYLLKIQYKISQYNCNSWIGLCCRQGNDDSWIQEQLNFCLNSTGKVANVEKGTNVWGKRTGEGEIEVRISIEDQIFQIIDLPSRENVVGLSHGQRIFKSWDQYYLVLYLYQNQDQFAIKDLQILDEFPQI